MLERTLILLLCLCTSFGLSQELYEVDSVWLYPFVHQNGASQEKTAWLSENPSGYVSLTQPGVLASAMRRCGTVEFIDSTFFQLFFKDGMRLTGYEFDSHFYVYDSNDSISEVLLFADKERQRLWTSGAFMEQNCQIQNGHISGLVLSGNFQGGRNLNISPDAPNVILEGNFFKEGDVAFNVHFKAFLDGTIEYFEQHPEMSFEIIASPDNYAPEHRSLLGQLRAEHIITYLIDEGCSSNQLVPFGYGHGSSFNSKSKELQLGNQDWFIIRLLYVEEELRNDTLNR